MMKIKANTLFLIGVAAIALFALSIFLVTAFSIDKPQDPARPYPYISEEVTFPGSEANITLAGTLTLPAESSAFPAVVLISGSGPQNRNEELVGHKPFLV